MALPRPKITPQEYLRFERASQIKHEFLNGDIFAMTGASRAHNLIATNVSGRLMLQLDARPCEVYQADMRVRVSATGLYTYPDVVVVCGTPQFEDKEMDTLLNPTVIIEVLSPSTEAYDRGKKFEHYRTIPSLQEYVLIVQNEAHIDLYRRQEKAWELHDVTGLNAELTFISLSRSLDMSLVYRKVTFGSNEQGNT
jgi:Uma2 family endonuclease